MREEKCSDFQIIAPPSSMRRVGCGNNPPVEPGGIIPPVEIPQSNPAPLPPIELSEAGCDLTPTAECLVYKRVMPGINLDGFPDWFPAPGSLDWTAHYNVTLLEPNDNMVINGTINTRTSWGPTGGTGANTSYRESWQYFQNISSAWCDIPYNRSVNNFGMSSGYLFQTPPPTVIGAPYTMITIREGFVVTARFINVGDRGCEYLMLGEPGGYVYYHKATTTWNPNQPLGMPSMSVSKKFSIIKKTKVTQCGVNGFTITGELHPLKLLGVGNAGTINGFGQGGAFSPNVGGGTVPDPNFGFNLWYSGTCPDSPSFGGNFRATCVKE